MEINSSMRKWIAFFVVALLLTNVANYYLFNHGVIGGKNSTDADPGDSTRVIRYDPDRYIYDAETSLIWETIDTVNQRAYSPVDISVMVEGAVKGILESIDDPFTQFYVPAELEEFMVDIQGTYGGIGVRIIEVEPYVVVFETMVGTPAERNEIIPGDRIIEADGEDLIGQGVSRAVELMRGPENTSVELKIARPGADEPIMVTVEREQITVPTVFSEHLKDEVGYINISSFDRNTAAEFGRQLQALEQQGISKGLVLDLRNNLGGLVDQAIAISQHIVPEGEIASVIDGSGEVIQTYYSDAEAKPYPIVVLINEESASASELVAGALKDSGAAMLVGQTTFGKDAVQNLEYLSGNHAIRLTVARYFTPSGHDIYEHGIEPDFKIEMSEALRYYRYFFPGRMQKGSYGSEVEMLQMMLLQIGYDVEETGYYDQSTADAIADFQEENNITVSSEFDDKTWVQFRLALDKSIREDDDQLNYAIELIGKPGLWTLTGGNNQ